MGSEEGASWERPVHQVEISAFWIAKRPVTNGEFRAFRPDHHSPVNDADGAPARAVSWEDARAYSEWLGAQTGAAYRLPTEAEWERAIRGGLEQKKYPWGDDPAVPEESVANRAAWPPPPANGFGLFVEYELWEWTADIYDRNYYEQSPREDPKGPAKGDFRVLRGGSYPNDPNSMRCANRGSARPRTTLPNVTFRVARNAGPAEVTELRRPVTTPAPGRAPSPPLVTATRTTQAPAAQAAAAAPVPAIPPPAAQPAAETRLTVSNAVPPSPAAQKASSSATSTELTRVDVTVSTTQVILALSLSGNPGYSTMELSSPDRIVIDFANTAVATARQYGSVDVADLGVQRVRWAPFQAGSPTARIVIDLLQPVNFTIDAAENALVIHLRPR